MPCLEGPEALRPVEPAEHDSADQGQLPRAASREAVGDEEGAIEVATQLLDPAGLVDGSTDHREVQPPGRADMYVMLKPRNEWPDPGKSKAQLLEEVEAAAMRLPGTAFEFSQPIQLRFNELISGVRSDMAVKLFGDDFDELARVAGRILRVIERIPGAAEPAVEQVSGLPVTTIEPRRMALARYGLDAADVQDAISAAVGGRQTGLIYEGDARYPLEVRLPERLRADRDVLARLPLSRAGGGYVPLSEVADIHSPAPCWRAPRQYR